MSGTSTDGTDLAAIRVNRLEPPINLEVLAFETVPYPAEIRAFLLHLQDSGTLEEFCRANVLLGRLWAEAVRGFCARHGLATASFDVIGSHGQTLRHEPGVAPLFGLDVRGTLQAGDGATLAVETGLPVVADFRLADLAAGGQGAPLVPLFDFLVFQDAHKNRALLNIGGIANLTLLPAGGGLEDLRGFDTGPGNMLSDALVAIITDGGQAYDPGGRLAAQGTVCAPLLDELMAHPFVQAPLPKSTGREEFGRAMARRLYAEAPRRLGLSFADLLATINAFTARSIACHLTADGPTGFAPDEVIASGGGVHNVTLMERLQSELGAIPVRRTEDYGLDGDAKEAVAFAVLALRTLHGLPGNVPSVTGARRSVVLGKLSLP
jgi:anhydro-N-acetylmuramic acid kinase